MLFRDEGHGHPHTQACMQDIMCARSAMPSEAE